MINNYHTENYCNQIVLEICHTRNNSYIITAAAKLAADLSLTVADERFDTQKVAVNSHTTGKSGKDPPTSSHTGRKKTSVSACGLLRNCHDGYSM